MSDGDRLRFICEDGRFTITARVAGLTHTYRIEAAWLADSVMALKENRLSVVELAPDHPSNARAEGAGSHD